MDLRMHRPLYKPFRKDEFTASRMHGARLHKPFQIQLCDEHNPDEPCFPGMGTLKMIDGEYWFDFVADHDPSINFRESRELALQWLTAHPEIRI
jgi:hypothetical protein